MENVTDRASLLQTQAACEASDERRQLDSASLFPGHSPLPLPLTPVLMSSRVTILKWEWKSDLSPKAETRSSSCIYKLNN